MTRHVAPYTPHTDDDVAAMLGVIGASSLQELVRVPDGIAPKLPLDLPEALPESELVAALTAQSKLNTAVEYTSFLGAGAYRHYTPPVVMALAMRGEFVTAYTPYQAEVSQGYLQAIYEWQTYISLLTGMDLANASVYDGATALAESAIMAVNATGRRALLVSEAVHPNYRAVLKTYADGLDLDVDLLPIGAGGTTDFSTIDARLADGRYAAVVVQSPNFFGCVDVPGETARAAFEKSKTIPIAVVAEPLSLAAFAPPSDWGAQIVAGEAQSFGVPVSFGGPYAGFVATTSEHIRRIPGRLVGKSVDVEGKEAYVLTLQAREQHIRREKATSNICTNQAHCALIATIYLATLGATGLRECAALNLSRARDLAAAVSAVDGFSTAFTGAGFNEVVIRVPKGRSAADVLASLREKKILGGLDLGRWYPQLADCILMCATELTTKAEIAQLQSALRDTAAREAVSAR